MNNDRIVILDASCSLFPSQTTGGDAGLLTLQPIPDFRDVVTDVVREFAVAGKLSRRMRTAPIDVGIICDGEALPLIAWELHRRVEEKVTV